MYIKKIIKSFDLLDKKEKNKFYFLFFLMFIAYLLETASLGSIIPLLTLLSGNQSNEQFQILNNLDIFSQSSKENKLRFFVLLFLLLFVLKNIYLVLYKWFKINFITNLKLNLSSKLYKRYLSQPYLFFVKQKSSKLIRNVLIEPEKFASTIIESVTNLILEIVILLTISIFLFLYDPKSFIFITILAVSTFFLFSLFTKNKLIQWSKDRALFEGRVINKLQNGFNLSKIIKIFFKNKKFNLLFQIDIKKLFFATRNKNILSAIPKHLFEVIAIFSLAFLVIYLLEGGKKYGEIIILLGLFSAAAFRIFPSIVSIVSSLQSIQFNLPSLSILMGEFKRPNFEKSKQTTFKKLNFKNQISLHNICFSYPEKDYLVLNKLNLTIKKNKIIGIVGASGSGKSTLIDIILGVIKPTSGEVRIDGKKIIDKEINHWTEKIGYVPQGVYLLDDTIEKNIAFQIDGKNINHEKVVKAAKIAQIHNFISSLPNKYKTKISEKGSNLSEGQKQRVSIARALYNNPEILILDEASSSLDTKTEKNFIQSLKKIKGGKTIIIISHRFPILNLCEHVYLFDLNKKFKKIDKKFVKQIS